MNPRKSGKQKNAQRQKFTVRMVIIAGISMAAIAGAIFFYLEMTKTEPIKAANPEILTPGNLPSEMVIPNLVVSNADTNHRNGNRYKLAKPLSLTPSISQ